MIKPAKRTGDKCFGSLFMLFTHIHIYLLICSRYNYVNTIEEFHNIHYPETLSGTYNPQGQRFSFAY